MRCEKCKGQGRVPFSRDASQAWPWAMCEECGGCGEQSCCHGHEAQPEPEDE